MTTWEQARQIVDQALRPAWDPSHGTFYVAPWGRADRRSFLVVSGPREWLVEDGSEFVMDGQVLPLVDRDTGALSFTTYLLDRDRIDAMERVGCGHPLG